MSRPPGGKDVTRWLLAGPVPLALDPDARRHADAALAAESPQAVRAQGAAVAVEPEDGQLPAALDLHAAADAGQVWGTPLQLHALTPSTKAPMKGRSEASVEASRSFS